MERFEDAAFRALKMEEGDAKQGLQAAVGGGKRK